ncbi:hypothetical protein SD78_1321 [Bacillus badius]|nr:hypothetical protein SD78_1321 [Bacillus badius]
MEKTCIFAKDNNLVIIQAGRLEKLSLLPIKKRTAPNQVWEQFFLQAIIY